MLDTCSAHRMVALFFCLSLLLNVGILAQSRPTNTPLQSPGATPIVADNVAANKLASAPDSTNPINNAVEKIEAGRPPALASLKTSLMHPSMDFEILPSVAKIETLTFAEPDEESIGAPRNFQATAYSLRGRTASGVRTRPGVIAADPRVLPIGTIVQVKAGDYSGIYTVHDTGRRVKGKIVDIWIPTYRDARKFGRRAVKVQVLSYGPRRQLAKN